LRNNCSEEESPLQPMLNDEQEDDGFIDMDFFYISFVVCYIIVMMTISAVLYINPYWRHRWFYFIEDCIDTCYYFVLSSFCKFSNFRRWLGLLYLVNLYWMLLGSELFTYLCLAIGKICSVWSLSSALWLSWFTYGLLSFVLLYFL
jgi:hypothetical protein